MKWFFAFNQVSEASYGHLVRVAVRTAIERAQLQPFCLYDGQEGELSRWLQMQGVTIWPTRFRFADVWDEVAKEKGDPGIASIAKGAFLRLELPHLLESKGISDEFILYTDCDVMFQGKVEPLLHSLRPRFFAVGPEMWPQNYLHMNTGVMWFNLPAMRKGESNFMKFVERHLRFSQRASWDQGIYRAYFNPLHRFFWNLKLPDRVSYRVFAPLLKRFYQWEHLPLELNWKPFWGVNPNARIVHFHGPKPQHLEAHRQGTLLPVLRSQANDSWEAYCAQWQQISESI